MRLATVLTPAGPRAVVPHANRYVDLHATDPGLPASVKHLIAASPAVRKAAAEARTPYTSSELYKNSNGKPLSIEEMRAGRNPNNYVHGGPAGPVGRQLDKSVMSPDELRSYKQDETTKLEGDGLERRYLSDPPGGLLKAAAGAPLKASADPQGVGDPDSPHAFIRQQEKR